MSPISEETQQMLSDWEVLSDTTKFTFPSKGPRRTIDYIWGLKGCNYEVLNYEVLDEPVASDHQPLYADIKF
jgi:endonuclease/exonuclease/phosphatase family metal-dependent hydrolase